MKDKGTFNQWIAGIITIISLLGVISVIFIPSKGDSNSKGQCIGILGSAVAAGIIMFLKAGSDAQHSDQIKQMTEGLINSTPIKNS